MFCFYALHWYRSLLFFWFVPLYFVCWALCIRNWYLKLQQPKINKIIWIPDTNVRMMTLLWFVLIIRTRLLCCYFPAKQYAVIPINGFFFSPEFERVDNEKSKPKKNCLENRRKFSDFSTFGCAAVDRCVRTFCGTPIWSIFFFQNLSRFMIIRASYLVL